MSDLIAVIIPAGGSGERLGAAIPKALVHLAGKTLVEHAVAHMAPVAHQIIVAAPIGYEEHFQNLLGSDAQVISGGSTRTQSVKNALKHIDGKVDFVLVHDAARPLASTELALRIIDELRQGERAVIPGLPVADTIKRIDMDGYVRRTYPRSMLRQIQTPQGFKHKILVKAHQSKDELTDDAGLVENMGIEVKVIDGEVRALKVTTMPDLQSAQAFLIEEVNPLIRVGIGTDTHAFSKDSNRALWLAGLYWPDQIGVDGHSDGDVAIHAICDALFSAAGLGDLGANFGTDDPQYEGASGQYLLSETLYRVREAGYQVNNVSVQVIGNRPRIGSRRAEAIATISKIMDGVSVSVSATTTDGMGFTGEGQGLSAIATALLIPLTR